MRLLRSSIFTLMVSVSAATLAATAHAQVSINVRVGIPPPPLPYYEQPVIPAAGFLWIPGFWAWDQIEGDYYWVPGTWVEPPRRELLWTPAYWSWVGGRYVFHSGYWAREVGYYGGIDYGYGYTGEGYRGGRWERGTFYYNRSVNNVESARVTNVYEQPVVVSRTSNVSFNGGNGGTSARPTRQQETIANGRHVEATPVQRQQVLTARKDRALFSKENHGEPAIAATPRAGVFQGAGVSRGSRTPAATKPNNVSPNGERPGTGLNKETSPAKPGEHKGGERPNAERPGTGLNKELSPSKADEEPKGRERPKSGQQSPESQRRLNQKEAPKTQEERRPVRERSKNEEQQKPQERPKAEERRTPPPEPRIEERRGPAQEPRVQEQRRPVDEPKVEEHRRPAQEPRVEEQRRPTQPPRAEEQRQPTQAIRPEMQHAPTAAPPAGRPPPAAAPGGRHPPEEKNHE